MWKSFQQTSQCQERSAWSAYTVSFAWSAYSWWFACVFLSRPVVLFKNIYSLIMLPHGSLFDMFILMWSKEQISNFIAIKAFWEVSAYSCSFARSAYSWNKIYIYIYIYMCVCVCIYMCIQRLLEVCLRFFLQNILI